MLYKWTGKQWGRMGMGKVTTIQKTFPRKGEELAKAQTWKIHRKILGELKVHNWKESNDK